MLFHNIYLFLQNQSQEELPCSTITALTKPGVEFKGAILCFFWFPVIYILLSCQMLNMACSKT